MPVSEAVVRRLGWLDAWAQIGLHENAKLSPSALAKKFNAIASAAHTLIEALGAEAGFGSMPGQVRSALRATAERHAEQMGGFRNHPPAWFNCADGKRADYREEEQLADNIEAVRQLHSWARQAEQVARGQVSEPERVSDLAANLGIEKRPDEPINDAIAGILGIWSDILGRKIKTSTTSSEGKASGPLIRFAIACLALLRLSGDLTPDAIRARIERARKGMGDMVE